MVFFFEGVRVTRTPLYFGTKRRPNEVSAKDLVQWKEVSKALGVSDRYRIYVTNVLNLSQQAQELIEQHNLSERVIRPIVQKLKGQPDLQTAALYQVIVWQRESESDSEGESGQAVDKAVEKLVDRLVNKAERQRSQQASRVVAEAAATIEQARLLSRQAQNALKAIGSLEASHRLSVARELAMDSRHQATVKTLQELRKEIDNLLHQIGQYQTDSDTSIF